MIRKRITFNLILVLILFLAVSCRENSGDGSAVGPQQESNISTINFNVDQPVLAQVYKPGETLQISWETDISNPSVDIALYKKSSEVIVIAENTTFQDGFMRWQIPTNITNSRHYRILVQNHSKPIEHAFSDYFYILNQ
ncbi:MAG: hypothetical protein SCALA702_11410 [Melioribacteraceae bacterium]|nr:MAG: hypothetical protein SCALA702_11410 [Melioribacteraceae bacterium]